jgi:hypothetical protein
VHIYALHVNKTFNTYTARLQKLANKGLFFIVLEKNNRITEYSAQIKSKSGFASEFDPQLTQKSSKSKIAMPMGLTVNPKVILNVNKTFNTYRCTEPDCKVANKTCK